MIERSGYADCYTVKHKRIICKNQHCVDSLGYDVIINNQVVHKGEGCFTSYFLEKYVRNSNKVFKKKGLK